MEQEQEPQSPPIPPSTLRRNPPRRARHTPFVPASLARFNPSLISDAVTVAPLPVISNPVTSVAPFSLDDAEDDPPPLPVISNPVTSVAPFSLDDAEDDPPPLPVISNPVTSNAVSNLNVFLRIRPDEIKTRRVKNVGNNGNTGRGGVRKGSPVQKASKKKVSGEVCLAVTGPGSVMLTIPKAKLVDSKRGTKNEVYDGFSFVFPPGSRQNEVYEKVMDPLVSDFIGGKSSLLVAMGPTGSGKTHTMFGTNRDPGLVPLALKNIFSSGQENPNHQRSFYLAMVEIYSTSGKGEKMIDLLSAGTELTLVQTTIKGLEEVPVSNLDDAERFLLKGMSKRCTAATDANSQSSRSQCIITIRRANDCFYNGEDSSFGNGVLMIADLAGAERERKTGNLGSRLGESNFINNTSMVFGLCLRSLLEHQKNSKKAFQKHYKDSLLTRYLKDYLEGKKKMTLILTVKRGEEDYTDTSYVLRQASPYTKITYTNLEENNGPPKRTFSSYSLIQQENKKRRKVGEKVCANLTDTAEISGKVIEEVKRSISPKPYEKTNSIQYKQLVVELEKAKRNEEMMTNFAKAFWKCLKLYKQKLSNSEQDANSMKDTLKEKDKEIMELKEELKNLSQNNNFESALESEISEDLKGFDGFDCEGSSVCDSKREIDSRDSDDVASFVVTESSLSSKDETVLYEDQISERKYENPLEQKQKEDFLTEKDKTPCTDNGTLCNTEQVECNWEYENVIQHTEAVNESVGEEFLSSNVDEINGSLEEIDDADERNNSSVNLQETLHEIEGGVAEKDITCTSDGDFKETNSANLEESELEMRELKEEKSEEFKEETREEMNPEEVKEINLEELEQENTAEESKEETVTGANEEIKEEIIDLTGKHEETKEAFEIQEENIANLEDFTQEESGHLEELSEEISDNNGEIIDDIIDNEEIKEEIIDNEELKLEIHAAECEQIKEGIIINSPLPPQTESSTDKSDKSEEKSTIERRKNCQPIENLIEMIGKENLASINPGKVTKPKRILTRRLLPASSMLLNEFTGPDSEVDILKEGKGKATAAEKARSEGSMHLIQILTAKPSKLIREKN